ncbi:YqgE/AlgH family protein [Streptomyces smyrnaeus]|uniref:YqgE/AlgH family protein n=1 Tax=Streptomyces smyrnaeus TaxID=1387713 RepID=A0ABS3Y3B6_9ACTN|nr:YqgE/AlgH family protein [Streptomyces smyrnaeus]MBO8202074.1 YqgE/AlgH family protein [Streptomyces smyrnaeus]
MTEVSSLTGRLLVATPVLADPNFDRAVVLLLDHDEEGSLGVVLNRPTPVDVSDILEPWAALTGEPGVVFQGGPVSLDAALGVAVVPSGRGDRTDGGPGRAVDGGPGAASDEKRAPTADSAQPPGKQAEEPGGRPVDRPDATRGPAENAPGPGGPATGRGSATGKRETAGESASGGDTEGADTAEADPGAAAGIGPEADTDTVLDTDGPLGWRRVHGAIGLVDLEAPPELLAAELGSLRIFAGYAGWGPGQLEKELSEGAWYVVESEPGDVSSPAPERLWRSVLRRQRSELALVATYPDDPSLN